MPRFQDIPKFPVAHYEVDVGWEYLEEHLRHYESYRLEMDPDFQRAHVWSREQQIAYVEYVLMEGEVARNVTFNCPGWGSRLRKVGPMQLVDGKQRIEAARAFLRGDIPAFGHLYRDYGDRLDLLVARFRFRICSLDSRTEVLRLYLNINAGGTPHTAAEIERVRAMLRAAEKGT